MGSGNTVTFPDITVAGPGMYNMEIDYVTKVPRLLYVTVNGGDPIPLNLTGDSEDYPTSLVVPVELKDGKNTVQFGNPDEQAPALDKIAIALPFQSTDLTLALELQKRSGPSNFRTWTFNLANSAPIPAESGQLNLLSLVQVNGARACQPKVLASLPVSVGIIPKQDARSFDVPIDFSSCSNDAAFNVSIVYSADHGAVVGNVILTGLSQ